MTSSPTAADPCTPTTAAPCPNSVAANSPLTTVGGHSEPENSRRCVFFAKLPNVQFVSEPEVVGAIEPVRYRPIPLGWRPVQSLHESPGLLVK